MNTEIGVIRRNQIPAANAPRSVVSTEVFAAAMANRYAPQAVTVSRADLALACEPPREMNYFQSSPRIEISPSIVFQERYVSAGAPQNTPGVPAAPSFGERDASALFERLFSRHRRVAAFDSPSIATEKQREHAVSIPRSLIPASEAAAVERVMPRRVTASDQKSSPSSETATPVPTPARDMGWGTPIAFPETPKPLNLPAPEIKRVTEQVMREIDRRVIAQKERTGRR